MTHEQLIGRAIRLSVENVAQGGGPFGAVVARGGEIVAEGVNRVTAGNSPVACWNLLPWNFRNRGDWIKKWVRWHRKAE